MPDSRTVQLAIKYASRLHLMQLAERLGSIAQQKADDERNIETQRSSVWYRVFVFMNISCLHYNVTLLTYTPSTLVPPSKMFLVALAL